MILSFSGERVFSESEPSSSLTIPSLGIILPIEIHLRAHNLSLVPLKILKNVLTYKINEELLIFLFYYTFEYKKFQLSRPILFQYKNL